MASNAGNAFTSAARGAANRTTGAKGANMLKESGDLRLDAFLGLTQYSTDEDIDRTMTELITQCSHVPTKDRGLYLADIWRLMVHKRQARTGERTRHLGRRMFFILYEHFPQTCIAMVKAQLIPDMGYWKDYLLIWKMIMERPISDKLKFEKYDPLIQAIRETMMTQRTEDLKRLDEFVAPQRIRDISKDALIGLLKASSAKLPSLTWIGKYCVRESSADNKRLYWWVEDPDTNRLYKQSHVSYMLRFSLKRRVAPGEYQLWGVHEKVPSRAKQSYQHLNAKLNEALDVPEVKATLDRLDEIDPSKVPGEFRQRNIKFLLNERVKGCPTEEEEETGNRRPDDDARVALRKRTREMFTDPDRLNVDTLQPHEIAYKARTVRSRAEIDGHNAAFEKKARVVRAQLDEIQSEMAAKASMNGGTDTVARAAASGRIVGVADVSGSMETVAGGDAPNRPIDIATGLVAFIARIAAEPYRGIAMSFTDTPTLFNLKVGERMMNARESMGELHSHVGYNTNYQGMHEALIQLCVDNQVPEDELPVLYIASDMNFDQMDKSLNTSSTYNYRTGRYDTPAHGKASSQIWETTHEAITKMWVRAGYRKVPLMVYHNINTTHSGVQAEQDFKGVILLTGRSEQVIKLVLYGEVAKEVEKEIVVDGVKTTIKVNDVTPYDTFRKAMEADHFALLERELLLSQEGAMKYITHGSIGGYTAKMVAGAAEDGR
jgi:hypothetical protein